jgi:CRISPR-associated protein Cmr5
MNGLGQACVTLLSQQDINGHRELYDDLQSWLCGTDEAAPYRNAGDAGTRLMEEITSSDETTYFRAQAEALAYLVWLKKLAKAFLDQGGSQ